MPKKYGKMESDSSTSQSDDEKPRTGEGSRKSRDKKKGPGPKKRLAESPGATSSGIVPPPIHSLKGYTEQVCASPSKKTRPGRHRLVRSDAFDEQGGEDSNQALSIPMRSLGLKGESGEKEPNEPQPPGVSERVTSAAELEQSPKMSHVQSSEVHPTSSKKKGVYDRLKDKGKQALGGIVEKLRSPKHSPDKGSSSEKAKLKQKPLKGDPLNLNRAKTGASSSSSSPRSKRGYSSLDRSLPSTSSSGPNVEYQRPAKKSPLKSKGGPESSSASTSDVSRRRGETKNVSSGGEGARIRKSPRRFPSPQCDCGNPSIYTQCKIGCARRAHNQRKINNSSCSNTYDPSISSHYSSSSALDPNVEYSRATKSPNKSKNTGSPRVSTGDPSQPGTSRLLDVPPSGNSPNRCDEAARSPNRSSPTKSPSQSSPTHPSPCICSKGKIRRGEHDDDCPFRSHSRRR